jgi:hypothetical protein
MTACIVVSLVGLLLYVIPGVPPKLVDLGRIAFAVGLFWLVSLLSSGHALHI